jgi:arsenite/tail-anchored protein-transporting ATPase
MEFLLQPTRVVFFTGKGGVGKTSIACSTAVRLADLGKRVLLVSTDPASNLDEVLGVRLGVEPTVVDSVPGLMGMNLDPEQSAAAYRERMVAPYRGILPESAITSMEEQFSGACTLEIAAFDEFAKLLGDPTATANFDHVLFDTAPTGHTLRMLSLPSAWVEFMEHNSSGVSCLGPLSGLQSQQKLYAETVRALCDPKSTTLVLVTRPELSAMREAARTSNELHSLGVMNQHLVINGVFHATDNSDPIAVAMQLRCEQALQSLPASLQTLPRTTVPLSSSNILGIEALRHLGTSTSGRPKSLEATISVTDSKVSETQSLAQLMDEIEVGGHGVVMTMGKGGVGKTTIAAAIALALAERNHHVLLTTTDPASHVVATMNGIVHPNLKVESIDPAIETAKYRREVMDASGAQLDDAGRALLEEDLRSPCTEEIAVFRAFARAVDQGQRGFVVLDTAPTGHTILLLDAALAYHREVHRQSSQVPESVRELLPRLRDPEFTKLIIVTLPEATPVHEAVQLQRDLRRAKIEPYAWVVNQCLTPLTLVDPTLCERRRHEVPYLREVKEVHSQRMVVVPWHAVTPSGHEGLGLLLVEGQDQSQA